jgi:hypothetical protein
VSVWVGDLVGPSSRVPDLPVADVLALSGAECQN